MKKDWVIISAAVLTAIAAWQAAPAIQNAVVPALSAPKPAAPSPQAAPKPPPLTGNVTPMEQRVATIGLLNKRNGLWRDLTMKPGEAVRIGDVVIRLKACETTAPWELEQLSGAFVQVIVNGSDDKWRKVFSGWLYKESPSLNVVEHPIYDVWAKACTMRHPDTGPDTIVVRGASTPGNGKSKAKKSAPAAEPEAEPESAADSDAI